MSSLSLLLPFRSQIKDLFFDHRKERRESHVLKTKREKLLRIALRFSEMEGKEIPFIDDTHGNQASGLADRVERLSANVFEHGH